MLWLLTLVTGLAHAGPITLNIADPQAIAVVLTCSGKATQATVQGGVAVFAELPAGRCDISLIRRMGSLTEPGIYACSGDSCSMTEFHHLATTDGPGTVNIWLEGDYPHNQLELACVSGHRDRINITDNTVVFQGVPDTDCTLQYKGGPPATFQPMRWGTYRCQLNATQAVCTMVSKP